MKRYDCLASGGMPTLEKYLEVARYDMGIATGWGLAFCAIGQGLADAGQWDPTGVALTKLFEEIAKALTLASEIHRVMNDLRLVLYRAVTFFVMRFLVWMACIVSVMTRHSTSIPFFAVNKQGTQGFQTGRPEFTYRRAVFRSVQISEHFYFKATPLRVLMQDSGQIWQRMIIRKDGEQPHFSLGRTNRNESRSDRSVPEP